MDIEGLMLSEVSQRKTNNMISYVESKEKNLIDTEERLIVEGGRDRWVK